jgi:hypothetical protein
MSWQLSKGFIELKMWELKGHIQIKDHGILLGTLDTSFSQTKFYMTCKASKHTTFITNSTKYPKLKTNTSPILSIKYQSPRDKRLESKYTRKLHKYRQKAPQRSQANSHIFLSTF